MGRIVWIPTYCRRPPPAATEPKQRSRCGGGYDRWDRYGFYGRYGLYGYPGLYSYTEQRYPYV